MQIGSVPVAEVARAFEILLRGSGEHHVARAVDRLRELADLLLGRCRSARRRSVPSADRRRSHRRPRTPPARAPSPPRLLARIPRTETPALRASRLLSRTSASSPACRSGTRRSRRSASARIPRRSRGASRDAASPFSSRTRSGSPADFTGAPPCIFSARSVATSTMARGQTPICAALDVEELLAAEIEAEAPFGDRVVAEAIASLVARTLLQPCAMLPNGPQWTIAGPPSAVWTRFGFSASRSTAVIAPAAPICPRGHRLAVVGRSRPRSARVAPRGPRSPWPARGRP